MKTHGGKGHYTRIQRISKRSARALRVAPKQGLGISDMEPSAWQSKVRTQHKVRTDHKLLVSRGYSVAFSQEPPLCPAPLPTDTAEKERTDWDMNTEPPCTLQA